MTEDSEDAGTFIAFEGMPVLSRAAFVLHSFAVLHRVNPGQPGFVCDDYLNAISAAGPRTRRRS